MAKSSRNTSNIESQNFLPGHCTRGRGGSDVAKNFLDVGIGEGIGRILLCTARIRQTIFVGVIAQSA